MANVNDLRKFLKKDMVKTGDLIHFKDEGSISEKEFEDKEKGGKKMQTVLQMEVLVNENMKPILYSPNITTVNLLKAAWGPDTKNWVGETGQVTIIEQLSFGKLDTVMVIKPLTNQTKYKEV